MTTTSYSQSSTYIACSKHWKLKYVDKWETPDESAALPFGSAFDDAVSAILQKKTDYIDIFNKKWFSTTNRKKEIVPIFDSKTISYGYNDFDEYVLKPEDVTTMQDWVKELRLNKIAENPIEIMKTITKNKKNPYKKPSENQIKYFNRCNWLSLKRKAEILLDAFVEQFMPQVEEVLAIQKHAYIKDETTGDAIMGFLDFVLKLKGRDKPTIFDLKTSANLYKQEQIDNTDQLTLYAAIEGQNFNTNEVGYVVCVKNIKKNSVGICRSCGHRKTGQHKTCDNKLQKPQDPATELLYTKEERCGGEWEFKTELQPEIQVLIESKTEQQMTEILLDQGNILEAMNRQIVYKNTSKCNNWYGSKCPYFNLCHHNDPTGLRKKGT